MRICKKRWIRPGVAAACSLAIVLSVFPSFADDKVSELENQTSALETELEGINQEILSLTDQISDTEMQVEILNGEIARTTDDLAIAKENENKQYEDMKTRIKYMYEHGNATLLEMLFSAEDMTDFLNKADFIENLSEYDRNSLNALQEIHLEIENQMNTLEAQKQSYDELQNQLESQQTELQAKADATSTDLNDVKAKLEQAKADEAARIAAEQEAARKAAEEAMATQNGGGYDDTIINNGGINVSADDVTLLAAIIQCEARQDYDSLLAVATVIMNRVESSRFPNSISGVVYASGQFEPVWTGRLDTVLKNGATDLSTRVAQDAIAGARLAAVADCYYFLYAASTSRPGVNIGGNLFFQSW